MSDYSIPGEGVQGGLEKVKKIEGIVLLFKFVRGLRYRKAADFCLYICNGWIIRKYILIKVKISIDIIFEIRLFKKFKDIKTYNILICNIRSIVIISTSYS